MGAWTLIKDYTVPSNTTSVVLDDFGTITKDDFVKVVMNLANGTASNIQVRLFPNTTAGVSGYDTTTNYHRQVLLGNGSSVAVARDNLNIIQAALASESSTSISYIKMSENGKYNIFTNRNDRDNANIRTIFDYCTSSNLTFNDPITSLTFSSTVTNGLGTGTRIQIYKLAATKVKDIIVTNNTTQVDLWDLDITPDSEYLLVSDAKNATTTNSLLNIFPNDLTTATNYYAQQISGINTAASAVRHNDARYHFLVRNNFSPTPNNSISYMHIKLSNIGAFTYQSYSTAHNTSSIELYNYFGSSTIETITSITKLSVKANVTNAIAAGSRFMLYKLY